MVRLYTKLARQDPFAAGHEQKLVRAVYKVDHNILRYFMISFLLLSRS